MKKEFINPDTIYTPTWQFNQAIKTTGGSIVWVSGLIGFRPDGSMPEGIVEQSRVAFENLRAVMQSAGGDIADIVKVNVYIGEEYARHADEIRAVRSQFFTGDYPVSTLVQVAGFANPDYLFEIEAIAVLPEEG